MEQFKLSSTINPNKVFVIKKGELEGRLEAEYYRPEIRNLEYNIRNKTTKRLKDFIRNIASGATPSITEEDKYYTDKEKGVPFLRVQNLQTNGKLLLDDVKYINHKTHETLLKRSQVKGYDLLVKITGVGRMAIASVAPNGFEGNTNQHMVVIKTGGKEISEYLAKYLNLDVTERLASRRSTGATRPALDYPALKSIPIIENLDFSLLHEAEKFKLEKEKEAKILLDGIDTYFRDVFSIKSSEFENSLGNRIFTEKFSTLSGDRIDANYFSKKYNVLESLFKKYPIAKLGKISSKISDAPHERPDFTNDNGIRVIMIEHLKPEGIQKTNEKYITKKYHEKLKSTKLKRNDLLMARIGVTTGITSIVDDFFVGGNVSGNITLIRIDSADVIVEYVMEFLNSYFGRLYIQRILSNSARDFLTVGKIKSIMIPKLPKSLQQSIVDEIRMIREKAFLLKEEGFLKVNAAKKAIENELINS